jgi:Zn-dependent peptidase ImmA (M78 family)
VDHDVQLALIGSHQYDWDFPNGAGYPMGMSSIGDRVLQALTGLGPGSRQRDVAEQIGMTPDAFSRALHGKRQFASIELARLAELIGADLHWLITGLPDPNRLRVAARHNFDHATRLRTIPGRGADEQVLADVALAYRQAYPDPEKDPERWMAPDWAESAALVRKTLGAGFVRCFADRLEQHLSIGVVRVAELSTAYSFTVGGRPVIALPASANWFRENWDLAHELGHLVKGHHDDGISELEADRHEAAANAFAAELLLPAETLKTVNWESTGDEELAGLVWDWGISTDALCRRLCTLLGQSPARIARWAAGPTQRLLRHHLSIESELDEITARMDEAAQRRFPLSLQEAHLKRVESGEIGRATLAWMLGIDATALEVDAPEIREINADDLASALGL